MKIAVWYNSSNEEELLKKALNSIPRNVSEIILVNDGSKDNTLKIAKEWDEIGQEAQGITY